jgi:hypothetical protein
LKIAAKFGGYGLAALYSGGLCLLGGLGLAQNLYKDSSNVFSSQKEMAKLAGRLLACALACSFPFTNQTISLVGFSLGC